MNLRFAYSCNAYMKFDVLEALSRIAALGFGAVELMADVPHLWPAETPSTKIDAVREALASNNLQISNVNAFMMNRIGDPRQPYWHPSWIEPSRAYRQVRIDHTRAALAMARQLGAPSITTAPGGPIESGSSYRAALNLFAEQLKPVADHAEEQQVLLLIEPEPGLLLERFEQYMELRDKLDTPFVGLNFDIGHAFCVGDDPAEWASRMASHTRHYHIEDIAADRVHKHLVPGSGAIDFRATLGAIRETAYTGWITIELYPFVDNPDEAGREALAHLTQIAETL